MNSAVGPRARPDFDDIEEAKSKEGRNPPAPIVWPARADEPHGNNLIKNDPAVVLYAEVARDAMIGGND